MPANKVIVRWIRTDRLTEQDKDTLWALLSPEESTYVLRFKRTTDRLNYTAAHALARAVLAEMTGREPTSWQFKPGPYGKPVPITRAGEPNIQLSLSHTRGLAIVAATEVLEVGVDTEWLGRNADISLAERYFSVEEISRLSRTLVDKKQYIFLALWTLKEAYLKGTAEGLTRPLHSFAVDLAPPRLIYSNTDQNYDRWVLYQRLIGEQHIAAIAVGCANKGRRLHLDEAAADMLELANLSFGIETDTPRSF